MTFLFRSLRSDYDVERSGGEGRSAIADPDGAMVDPQFNMAFNNFSTANRSRQDVQLRLADHANMKRGHARTDWALPGRRLLIGSGLREPNVMDAGLMTVRDSVARSVKIFQYN